MEITGYEVRQFLVPLDRSIGDSQIEPVERLELATLRLETDVDVSGFGLEMVNYGSDVPLPPGQVASQFEPIGERLVGQPPAAVLHRQSRGRGGQYGAGQFDRMIDVALWDLVAKAHDLPLYELLGGDEGRVSAYASGLAFQHDDETVRSIYETFADMGFTDVKVKVGFETASEDVERLETVASAFDERPRFMVDPNEAFSPKAAVRRVRAYADAGFDLYWIEDPVARTDVDGVRTVREALDTTHVNGGEYLDLAGKRELLERRAVDVCNVHGITTGREAAAIAHTYGTPLSVGNTPAEVGAHVAAALPECSFVEYSMLGLDAVVSTGIRFEDGAAVLPETPGHGVSLDESAAEAYARDG